MNIAGIAIKALIAILVAAMGWHKDPQHPKRRYIFWTLAALIVAGAVVEAYQEHSDSVKSDVLSGKITSGINGINSRLDRDKQEREIVKAQHRLISDQLGRFVAEATKLRDGCGPYTEASIRQLGARIEKYLRTNVDVVHEQRFKASIIPMSGCFAELNSYIFELEKVINDFQN